MIERRLLVLVLLVSVAHAMVHAYEISVPSVEQKIAAEYYGEDLAAGKKMTGLLSNTWRLMWGFGAILAGWLVDRYGSRRMLTLYLLGCAAACMVTASSSGRTDLFLGMVMMGAFASIYHPAGLALISHETTPETRPRALGIHGIFGSAGIGLTPLVAGSLMSFGWTWRQFYWWMAVPGILLGLVFLRQSWRVRTDWHESLESSEEETVDWRSFFTLTFIAAIQGFVYSALMSFLARYLSGGSAAASGESGNYLASIVLLLGCVGQDLAGRFARARLLERQLAAVTFGNVPFLVWMSLATAWDRPVAAGLLAMVHFMHQPIYNSLIAKYTPRRRRSLCYGFSFAMGLGLGSFGAGFAGMFQSDLVIYGSLAGAAAFAGAVCLVLCTLNPVRE